MVRCARKGAGPNEMAWRRQAYVARRELVAPGACAGVASRTGEILENGVCGDGGGVAGHQAWLSSQKR